MVSSCILLCFYRQLLPPLLSACGRILICEDWRNYEWVQYLTELIEETNKNYTITRKIKPQRRKDAKKEKRLMVTKCTGQQPVMD